MRGMKKRLERCLVAATALVSVAGIALAAFHLSAVGAAPRSYVVDGIVVHDVPGVENMRDVGGWVGLDGRKVRMGRVFRSAALNRSYRRWYRGDRTLPEDSRRHIVDVLGVRTDVDLRSARECEGMRGSPLGESVAWRHVPSLAYVGLVSRRGRAAFAELFRVFLDETAYPIVFHCQRGRDRAGTVATVLGALLGVCEDDLRRDYEFSERSRGNDSFDFGRFDDLMQVFAPYPGATLREKAEGYVKSLGFTSADVERFRSLMLEPSAGSASPQDAVRPVGDSGAETRRPQ